MDHATLQGRKLFIVEDDPLLQHLLTDKLSQLRSKGVEVHAVNNGEDGLVKAKEVRPDLVMLDLLLPGMSGFEFLEALRKEPELASVPVVILSNLSSDSDKERAKSLGVIAYLIKSNFSLKDISGAIEQILLGKQGSIASMSENPSIEKTSQGNVMYL